MDGQNSAGIKPNAVLAIHLAAVRMAISQPLPRSHAWQDRVRTALCVWRLCAGPNYPTQAAFGCAIAVESI